MKRTPKSSNILILSLLLCLLVSSGIAAQDINITSGDTPTLRFEQDNSQGQDPQIWDVAANEASFFINDISNSSTLPFQIETGAPSDSLYVTSNGYVGIGTSTPWTQFHIKDSGALNLTITGTNTGVILQETDSNEGLVQILYNNDNLRIRGLDSSLSQIAAGISVDMTDGNVGINCDDGGSLDLTVGDGNDCAGTYSGFNAGDSALTSSSSRTLKENLQEVEVGSLLEKIAAIDVYSYDFIDGPKDKLGLMAEDFHQVFGRGSDKLINNGEVQMALWLAVQNLIGEVDELKAALAAEQAKAN